MALYPSFDECIERIKMLYQWEVDHNKSLGNENKYLKSGNYKDTELQKMADELAQVRHEALQGFSISDSESRQLQEYRKNHINSFHGGKEPTGVSGGNWSYEFIPTSLGTIGYCYCNSCRRKAIESAERLKISWNDDSAREMRLKSTDAVFKFKDI